MPSPYRRKTDRCRKSAAYAPRSASTVTNDDWRREIGYRLSATHRGTETPLEVSLPLDRHPTLRHPCGLRRIHVVEGVLPSHAHRPSLRPYEVLPDTRRLTRRLIRSGSGSAKALSRVVHSCLVKQTHVAYQDPGFRRHVACRQTWSGLHHLLVYGAHRRRRLRPAG